MDLIEDFFVYLEVLFESEKIDEFWHLMELMEPMINNLKVTSMQMRLLGLKIRFTESTIWVQSICRRQGYTMSFPSARSLRPRL